MQDKFDAKLHASFDVADATRNRIEGFKKLAEQDPAAAAAKVSKLIPHHMQRVRTQAREAHGVDIAYEGWKEQFKQKQHTDIEAGLLLLAANHYLVLSRCQTKLDAYAADVSLSIEERAVKVCKVGVEALEESSRRIYTTYKNYSTRRAEKQRSSSRMSWRRGWSVTLLRGSA